MPGADHGDDQRLDVMNYSEEATIFQCAGDTLLGIVAKPVAPAQTGVVIVVGGPQYRAGSHRQFILLSRALADAGYAVLRFDHRGMGDSTGLPRDFESVSEDIGAALDALQACVPQVRRVVIWGLCDAASAALLYFMETQDPRVVMLCLLNPWVRSETSLARTHVKHYYRQRLAQKDFWSKVLRGKVAAKALRDLVSNLRVALRGAVGNQPPPPGKNGTRPSAAPFQSRMAEAWHAFPGTILLLLSADDITAQEFKGCADSDPAWSNAWKHPRLEHHVLDADHTFSSAVRRAEVEALTLQAVTKASTSERAVPGTV